MEGRRKGKDGEGEGGTCSKVLEGDRRPCQVLSLNIVCACGWEGNCKAGRKQWQPTTGLRLTSTVGRLEIVRPQPSHKA